ncbi:MFS transporter [Streptomyces sp. NPDC058251]|uniref:MFS transporter n=1 Tax=unclassified Streptomyces TaxID=2593676 RepID=UPI00364B626F
MPTTHASHASGRAGKPGLIMLAALLGLFIALLDVTVVTVALPTISTDLHASFSDLEWVANAYMLALAVFIVTAGRLGDLYGQRRVYTAGVSVFLIGSLACGSAAKFSLFGWSHIAVLHASRVVQGIGGAAILPLSLAIIYSSFEGKKRAAGLMLWGAIGGLATALGPLIGGFLVEKAGWEWIFLVNLPIGAVVLVAAMAGMRAHDRSARGRHTSLDLPGLVTVSAALLCLNLALINGSSWGWTSGKDLGLFVAAAALTGLFLVVEARSTAPIMDLSWFRRPSFGGSVLAGFLLGAGMFAALFYLSIYLQNGLGLSAMQTGVRLLPLTLMLIVGAPLGGRLVARFGVRTTLSAAFAVMAVGLALFTLIDPHGGSGSWTRLLPGMLVTGLTLGMVMPISSELTVVAAPQDQVGVAASAGTMFRQVGNAVGIALMGALMTAQATSAHKAAAHLAQKGALTPQVMETLQRTAVAHGTQHGAWYAAAVTLAGSVVVLLFVRDLKPAAVPSQAPAALYDAASTPGADSRGTNRPVG